MREYYQKSGVKRAITDFVYSGGSDPVRECAFYNKNIGHIQRNSTDGKDSVLVLDSENTFSSALRSGATAFYSSYWRYSNPYESSGIKGRDLAWSVKPVEGGISASRELTTLFLEALEREGFPDPFVKYSGKLGFDVLIPMERIQAGSPEDLDFLSNYHRRLTERTSDYIKDHSSFELEGDGTTFKLSGRLGTCLLTELRWRRGLLLAPMSLHPGSGLVSLPLLPSEVSNFSVVDASPEKVHAREWSMSSSLSGDRPEPSVLHSPKGTPVKA